MAIPLRQNVIIAGHHPCGLWALDKPGGVRSHPNTNKADSKALLTVSYDREAEAYTDARSGASWYLLNRLDAPTSGLLLVADNADLAAVVKALFAERGVEKTYFALVRGKPRGRTETWRDRLRVARGSRGARATTGGNQASLTEMRLVETAKNPPLRSLIELSPKTGRTHQLRVQCASRRLPIIGDATYGDFRFNRTFAATAGTRRLFLHAGAIRLQFEWKGQAVRFAATAKLPREFRQALEG